jgi:hypothetical protein
VNVSQTSESETTGQILFDVLFVYSSSSIFGQPEEDGVEDEVALLCINPESVYDPHRTSCVRLVDAESGERAAEERMHSWKWRKRGEIGYVKTVD